jgi:hypothetical protein
MRLSERAGALEARIEELQRRTADAEARAEYVQHGEAPPSQRICKATR